MSVFPKMMADSINILLCDNLNRTKDQLHYVFYFPFCLTNKVKEIILTQRFA